MIKTLLDLVISRFELSMSVPQAFHALLEVVQAILRAQDPKQQEQFMTDHMHVRQLLFSFINSCCTEHFTSLPTTNA